MLQVVFCDVGKGRARGSLPLLEMAARMSHSGLAVWPFWGTRGAGAALVLGDGEARLKGLYGVVPTWTSPMPCLVLSPLQH